MERQPITRVPTARRSRHNKVFPSVFLLEVTMVSSTMGQSQITDSDHTNTSQHCTSPRQSPVVAQLESSSTPHASTILFYALIGSYHTSTLYAAFLASPEDPPP